MSRYKIHHNMSTKDLTISLWNKIHEDEYMYVLGLLTLHI